MDNDQLLNQSDIDKLMSEDGALDSEWDEGGFGDKAAPAAPAPASHAFEPIKPATIGAAGDRSLDFILDIPLEVSVELGRTRMVINDLLQLGQGSVIELTKLAGEPLEILVNNKLVARGEVVVVNEKFGVRVTDIVSPMERVKSLS